MGGKFEPLKFCHISSPLNMLNIIYFGDIQFLILGSISLSRSNGFEWLQIGEIIIDHTGNRTPAP